MLVIISRSWSSSQKRQKQTWAELHSNHIFDIILTISTSSTSHHIYFLVRPSFLTFSFFCSNFLRPALLLSCGGVAVVVVRFDQGDIDFYSLRALHYHFAQVQFAVRVPDLWTGMLSLPRCCCTLHCRHPARWRRRPRHQHRHCRHYYYCWWCSVDAGCTLIWFLFPKTSDVLYVTGVSASFIALQNCNLENGGRVAWHQ